MAHSPAPHAHMVKVRDIATGQVESVWPVDARERVTHPKGGWEYVTDTTTAETTATADTPSIAAATPSPSRSVAEQLSDKSYADLRALAKQVGIIGNQPKADLIAALVPHVEHQALNIADVPGLPVTPHTTITAGA